MGFFDLFNSAPNVEAMQRNNDVNGLIKALKHKQTIIREKATKVLETLNDDRAIQALRIERINREFSDSREDAQRKAEEIRKEAAELAANSKGSGLGRFSKIVDGGMGCFSPLAILFVLACVLLQGTNFFRPSATQQQENIAREIKDLSSDDPVQRARAAYNLGDYGNKAKVAVPHLINLIDDYRPLKWQKESRPLGPFGPIGQSVPIGEIKPTSPSQEAVKTLNMVTGQNFENDKEKWLVWWNNNK
jgi:hypothetical protein